MRADKEIDFESVSVLNGAVKADSKVKKSVMKVASRIRLPMKFIVKRI